MTLPALSRSVSAVAARAVGAKRPRFVAFLCTLAGALPASRALACPNCAAGVEARRAVLGGDFALHTLEALLPFLVMAGIAYAVESLGRATGERT